MAVYLGYAGSLFCLCCLAKLTMFFWLAGGAGYNEFWLRYLFCLAEYDG
jgi:hypothetical protein